LKRQKKLVHKRELRTARRPRRPSSAPPAQGPAPVPEHPAAAS